MGLQPFQGPHTSPTQPLQWSRPVQTVGNEMISMVSLPDYLISRTLLYLAKQYAHGKAVEYVYEILEGKKHVETVSERRMTEGRKTER
jgi:hypothetical protein